MLLLLELRRVGAPQLFIDCLHLFSQRLDLVEKLKCVDLLDLGSLSVYIFLNAQVFALPSTVRAEALSCCQ